MTNPNDATINEALAIEDGWGDIQNIYDDGRLRGIPPHLVNSACHNHHVIPDYCGDLRVAWDLFVKWYTENDYCLEVYHLPPDEPLIVSVEDNDGKKIWRHVSDGINLARALAEMIYEKIEGSGRDE